MIAALSDISHTNQLKLTEPLEETAEKLFQYLFRIGRGIETFNLDALELNEEEESSPEKFRKQHQLIKHEIQKRLAAQGEIWKYADIQYFSSYSNGKKQIFFLSPNKNHSGWTTAFCKHRTDRERIFNLIFKIYLLSEELPAETLNGFEELLLVHAMNLTIPKTKTKPALLLWGQNIFINYNQFDVLTLTLTRKKRRFLPADQYSTLDAAELGEMVLYKKKKYYFNRSLDGRGPNSIKFMRFDTQDQGFKKFKKNQVYQYQFLMKKLGHFLDASGIAYKVLPFQANHYLENSFIKNVEMVETLEIINNSGADLTEVDKQVLENVLRRQGVALLSFYNDGKTISTYERVAVENEEKPRWTITQVVPWTEVKLDTGQNYLVFNKILDEEEESSMAYQQSDSLWCPTTKIAGAKTVDFYSQLKRSTNYMDTGVFVSVQGLNMTTFKVIGYEKSSPWSILDYPEKAIDLNALSQDAQPFTEGQFLEVEDLIRYYLRGQQDPEQLEKFYNKYQINFSTEFEKILIELGIKNWIRKSLLDQEVSLPVKAQSFAEKQFFAINVRKARYQPAKAVAVEFLYKEGRIYIKSVMRDVQEIEKRFPILRTKRTAPDQLVNQQYFVDEAEQIFISAYTEDLYTPTLVGREDIIERLENGTLEINRKRGNKLFPLVTYYNDDISQVKNLICLDLTNETFIQYYVPPAQSLKQSIKNGFRVYHLLGKTYAKENIPTSELIRHPITVLHFSTLTQNILRISENSQSSLLQKVAKVFIEN